MTILSVLAFIIGIALNLGIIHLLIYLDAPKIGKCSQPVARDDGG